MHLALFSLEWTLRPGGKLNIEPIAERLEVSPMPVRDAIRSLVADDLAVSALLIVFHQ